MKMYSFWCGLSLDKNGAFIDASGAGCAIARKKTRDASEQITLLARNDKISLLMAEFVTVKQVFENITSNRYIGE